MTQTPGAPDSTLPEHISAPVTAVELPALRRRVQAVLVATQILGGLGIATGVALAAVLARDVSGSEALSGLASTATVAGPALLAMPLAALMSARGRRAGLVLAYLIGAVGAGVAVLGAVVGSFPLLLLGLVGFGAGSSANLAARFAAADLAEPERRARAISTVVWATTIGAVLGPNIAAPAGRSVAGLGIPATAGPFVWAAGVFVVAAVMVALLLRPDPLLTARAMADTGTGDTVEARSLRAGMRAVRESPKARLALVTVAGSHTAMVSIMSMTPVALTHHGADIQLIGLVISGHIAGMYAFSPLMGWLSDRLGRLAGGGSNPLGGLLEMLTRSGLTDQTQSWVGTGENQPVSGAQIAEALPDGTLQKVAQDAGVTPQEAADQIAQSLPQAVDRLTPTGSMPSGSLEDIIREQRL